MSLNGYALDPDTHDLYLDSTGQVATTTSTLQDLIQRVKCRLLTYQGECYLNRDLGVPYFAEVLKKNPDLGRVRNLLLSEVLSVPGVVKVSKFDIQFLPDDREFKLFFTVTDLDGNTTSGSI